MEHKISVCSLPELQKVSSFLSQIQSETGRNIVLLFGNLGSGKTAFVKHFVQSKKEDALVDSPTFSIVNDYDLGNEIIHHFDLYRLDSVEEIEDFGFWDYIDSNNLCFIEWPDKIADLLPQEKVITVHISLTLNQCRDFTISY